MAIESEESTTQKLSEPFIGPRAFTFKEKDIFFGRDGETQKIVSLILSNQEILIYAQSGAGKTSIINAKVLPELASYEMQLLPPARVKGTIEPHQTPSQIKNIYIFSSLQCLDPNPQNTYNLTEFLAEYPRKRSTKNRDAPRVIIFDQFEELFTTYVKGWPEQREAFFLQVRDAINADPLLKVVFVIREEYLAQLEKYSSIMPDRLRTRFHLELLRRDAAMSAVKGPLMKFGHTEVANDVASKIVDDLLIAQVEDVFGCVVETAGEYVEPVHLQVVCQRLWHRGVPSDQKSISQTALGTVDDALEEFYVDAVEIATNRTETNEAIIREWCEKKLITSTGTRGIIHRETAETGGIPNSTIDILEQKYLIRKEQRAGASWYELTHDRLLKPIRESNRKWKEKQEAILSLDYHDEFYYGDKFIEKFEVQWFSFGSARKDLKPWHWKNCDISFEKISDVNFRFMVKRKKSVLLRDITKLRWDEKQKSERLTSKVNNYVLHYVNHFDVPISSLPKMITEEKIEEQTNLNYKEYGDQKDSWVLNLGTKHKIWTWKDNEDSKNIMINILESINKKINNQHISPIGVVRRENKINDDDDKPLVYPVVYHPTRDLRGVRNYIQEIHLNRSNNDKKILVTIVYNDEQLREHVVVDKIYRIIRRLRYGRTFDVKSFSIKLDNNGYPVRFDFPDIYSGHDNRLEKDNIHFNACDLKIKYYFDQSITRPILFINTSNHAMGEIDNNSDMWKIEYRLWDEQCPIYTGTNTRCEVEKYLSKHGIQPLFRKCIDSNIFFCHEPKKISSKDSL